MFLLITLEICPCPRSRKIATADSSPATIAGVEDIKISPFFILINVLHLPKLSTNLLSIKKCLMTWIAK